VTAAQAIDFQHDNAAPRFTHAAHQLALGDTLDEVLKERVISADVDQARQQAVDDRQHQPPQERRRQILNIKQRQ